MDGCRGDRAAPRGGARRDQLCGCCPARESVAAALAHPVVRARRRPLGLPDPLHRVSTSSAEACRPVSNEDCPKFSRGRLWCDARPIRSISVRGHHGRSPSCPCRNSPNRSCPHLSCPDRSCPGRSCPGRSCPGRSCPHLSFPGRSCPSRKSCCSIRWRQVPAHRFGHCPVGEVLLATGWMWTGRSVVSSSRALRHCHHRRAVIVAVVLAHCPRWRDRWCIVVVIVLALVVAAVIAAIFPLGLVFILTVVDLGRHPRYPVLHFDFHFDSFSSSRSRKRHFDAFFSKNWSTSCLPGVGRYHQAGQGVGTRVDAKCQAAHARKRHREHAGWRVRHRGRRLRHRRRGRRHRRRGRGRGRPTRVFSQCHRGDSHNCKAENCGRSSGQELSN